MVSKQPPRRPQQRRNQPQQRPLTKGQKVGCGCAGILAFFVLLGSCGALLDDSEPEPSPSPTPTASETPSATPSETAEEEAFEEDEDDDRKKRRSKKPTPPPEPDPTPTPEEPEPEPEPEIAYYSNCTEARASGAAPLYRGEPGYRSALDRDNDGVACDT